MDSVTLEDALSAGWEQGRSKILLPADGSRWVVWKSGAVVNLRKVEVLVTLEEGKRQGEGADAFSPG